MYLRYALLLGACTFFGGAARASYIVLPYSPPYNGTTNFNDVTLTLGVTVSSPTNPSQITSEDLKGTGVVADTSTYGFVFLTTGSNPVGNTLLLGENNTLTQGVALSLDLMPLDLVFQAPLFTGEVEALAIGLPIGTVTDPSLTPFVGTSVFGFVYQPNLSNPASDTLVYGLNFFTPLASAPEPSSFMLAGAGFFLIGFAAVRGCHKNVARLA